MHALGPCGSLALEPWVARSALLPAVCPVYLCASVVPWGATRHTACPVLRHSESGPLGLSVCKCRATGSASGQTACPFVPHSTSRVSSTPQLPVSTPPTGLDECLFFISLVSDFLAVRFSVSSGCVRRRSVSTYASILVLHNVLFFNALLYLIF